jgi:hypothetical protein
MTALQELFLARFDYVLQPLSTHAPPAPVRYRLRRTGPYTRDQRRPPYINSRDPGTRSAQTVARPIIFLCLPESLAHLNSTTIN